MFKLLFKLFVTFAKIGSVTFGGGIAMLPILERELSEKLGWTTEEELLEYFAIGQSTPGIIAVNVATFIGYKKAGLIGGIAATLGMIFPSIVIITLIAKFISNFSDIIWVQKALSGINVAVAAILTMAVIKFSKKSVKGILGIAIYLVSFSLVYFFKVETAFVLLGAGILGIIFNTIKICH